MPNGTAVEYTDDQAWGAIPNGTLIEKCGSKPGDFYPDGTKGTVIGSQIFEGTVVDDQIVEGGHTHFYFIEWEPTPDVPIGILMHRIRAV